jgi:hypothetical protein
MRITLNTHPLSDKILTSFGDRTGPPWLGGAYHPMGNGHELRVQPLSDAKAMIFTRPIGAKKSKSLVIPVVGYSMPADIKIGADGEPIWHTGTLITRLLEEFDLPPRRVHVQVAGRWLELAAWKKRELVCSEGSQHHREILMGGPDDLPVDAVEGATWAIETSRDHLNEIVHHVYVWSDLRMESAEQEQLWAALQRVMA